MSSATISKSMSSIDSRLDDLYKRILACGISTTKSAVRNAHKFLCVHNHSDVCSMKHHSSHSQNSNALMEAEKPESRIQLWSKKILSKHSTGCEECFYDFAEKCLSGDCSTDVKISYNELHVVQSYNMYRYQSRLADCVLCAATASQHIGAIRYYTFESFFARWYLVTNYLDHLVDYIARCEIVCDIKLLDDNANIAFSGPSFVQKMAHGSMKINGVRYSIQSDKIKLSNTILWYDLTKPIRGVNPFRGEVALVSGKENDSDFMDSVKLILSLAAHAHLEKIRKKLYSFSTIAKPDSANHYNMEETLESIYEKILSGHADRCNFDHRKSRALCSFSLDSGDCTYDENKLKSNISQKLLKNVDALFDIMDKCIHHMVTGLSDANITNPQYCAEFVKFFRMKLLLAYDLEQYFFGTLDCYYFSRRTHFRPGTGIPYTEENILKDNTHMIFLTEKVSELNIRSRIKFLKAYQKLLDTIPTRINNAIDIEKRRRYIVRSQKTSTQCQVFSADVSSLVKDELHAMFDPDKTFSKVCGQKHKYLI